MIPSVSATDAKPDFADMYRRKEKIPTDAKRDITNMQRRKKRGSTDTKRDFADMYRRKEKIPTDAKPDFADMHRRKEKIPTDAKQDSAEFFRRGATLPLTLLSFVIILWYNVRRTLYLESPGGAMSEGHGIIRITWTIHQRKEQRLCGFI